MFELEVNLESLKEQGMQLVNSAKKTAIDLAGKGKSQLDLINQQARLSKAQRQLGALVYSLHKSGEENQPLVDKYIEAIDEIEDAIAEIKAQMTPAEEAETAEAEEEAPAEEPPADEEPAEEEPVEEEPVEPRGATKVCPVCGAVIDADALFCNHCGAQCEE